MNFSWPLWGTVEFLEDIYQKSIQPKEKNRDLFLPMRFASSILGTTSLRADFTVVEEFHNSEVCTQAREPHVTRDRLGVAGAQTLLEE